MAPNKGASDIHVTVGSPIVFRINGALVPLDNNVLQTEDMFPLVKEIMTQTQYDLFKASKDIDFSYEIPGVARYRVNIYTQKHCPAASIRIIPTKVPDLEKLNLPDIIKDFTKRPQGLLLVTGPTGSGKTTTLAAMLDYINRNTDSHILTLEDPIEFLHEHKRSLINQREVGDDTVDFATGLRAALRQDPDVILVGELRDLETISIAVTAAETGHLVFGTLHTQDAAQTIDRVIDVFPPKQQQQIRIQLASVLIGVVAQRLVPKKDGSGRVAALEILVNTPAISNLIRHEKTHQILPAVETGKSYGMQTMKRCLRKLVDTGVITADAARSIRHDFDE